jgi:hypothetical protein
MGGLLAAWPRDIAERAQLPVRWAARDANGAGLCFLGSVMQDALFSLISCCRPTQAEVTASTQSSFKPIQELPECYTMHALRLS